MSVVHIALPLSLGLVGVPYLTPRTLKWLSHKPYPLFPCGTVGTFDNTGHSACLSTPCQVSVKEKKE